MHNYTLRLEILEREDLGTQKDNALPEKHVGGVELLETRHPESRGPGNRTRKVPPLRQGPPSAQHGGYRKVTARSYSRPDGGAATGRGAEQETMGEEGARGGEEFAGRRSGDGRHALHFSAALSIGN